MKRQLFSERHTNVEFININNDVREKISNLFYYFYKETTAVTNKYSKQTTIESNERKTYADLASKYELHKKGSYKPEISLLLLAEMDEYFLFDAIECWNYHTQDPEFTTKVNELFKENDLPYRLQNGEMQMKEKEFRAFDLINFLESVPTYKEIKLTVDQFRELAKYSGLFNIEVFCNKCNKEKTFSSIGENDFNSVSKWLESNTITGGAVAGGNSVCQIEQKYIPYKSRFLTIKFECSQCKQKYFFALLLKEFSITKIGQYPSFAKTQALRFVKYKNIIAKYYTELTRSASAYSQEMGVAAFVYLRRILEHLITNKYIALKGKDAEIKFIDKLKDIQKSEQIIPFELEAQKNQIYTVLSKGIHEYEETECLELYPHLLLVIELILDDELLRIEKNKKLEDAAKTIAKKAGSV